MQVTKPQLERQQIILKVLGFYMGHVDGVWGPLTIAAKKKFEADARFMPGFPSNGMPFAEGKPLPAGMTLNKTTGLFYHPAIEDHINPPKAAAPEVAGEEAAPVVEATVTEVANQPPQQNRHQQHPSKK